MEKKQMDYSPLWNRYLPMFEDAELTKEQVGSLTLAMMRFQSRGEMPVDLDPMCKVFWSVIHEDLKRARLKYDTAVANGKKGGRPPNSPKKAEQTNENPEKGITKTESKTTTKTESTPQSTSTNTGSAPAVAAGVCGEKKSFGEFGWIKLTQAQHEKLVTMMGHEELNRCIVYIDELAQSTGNRSRWKDWYLILRRCHEKRWHETGYRNTKQEIPKGASGILGPIELDAIRKLMAEDMPPLAT